jgi:hypothetical protein
MKKLVACLTIILLIAGDMLAQSRVSEKARDISGGQIIISRDRVSGAAARVKGVNINTAHYGINSSDLNSSNVPGITRRIVNDYRTITGISVEDLVFDRARSRNGAWHVSYHQTYRGIPIWRSHFGLTIEKNGTVHTLGGGTFPTVALSSISPQIGFEVAESTALGRFNQSGRATGTPSGRTSLVIYPGKVESGVVFKLAWRVRIASTSHSREFVYLVDANNGTILLEQDCVRSGGTYTVNAYRNYWPLHHYDTPVREMGFQGLRVTIINSGGSQVADGYTDINGHWESPYLGPTGYYLRYRFEFNTISGTYAAIQEASAMDQTNPTQAPPKTLTHDLVNQSLNAYHHVNVMHDYFKSSPFDYDEMDYQTLIYMDQGEDVNGRATGFHLLFGSDGGYYWAGAADVIYHEYTHNTVHHLYGDWIGEEDDGEGRAMDEGMSDYFSGAITDDPYIAESCDGERTCDNNFTMDDFNIIRDNGYTGSHANGQILSGACWDLRQAMSGVDVLVFNALARTPHAYEFSDFADNIVFSDDNDGNPDNGTPHLETIRSAFYGKKIYFEAGPPQAPQSVTISGAIGQHPTISWSANHEPDLSGYKVYRKVVPSESVYSLIATIASPTTTSYNDQGIIRASVGTSGPWAQYYVKAYDSGSLLSGQSNMVYTGCENPPKLFLENRETPSLNMLHEAYPNPFNPATNVRYEIAGEAHVSLTIYNTLGQEVAVLVDRIQSAGEHEAQFDGAYLPSGVYIARLVVKDVLGNESYRKATKLLLAK